MEADEQSTFLFAIVLVVLLHDRCFKMQIIFVFLSIGIVILVYFQWIATVWPFHNTKYLKVSREFYGRNYGDYWTTVRAR